MTLRAILARLWELIDPPLVVPLDEIRFTHAPRTMAPVTELEHLPIALRCLFCGHTLDVDAEREGLDVCSDCAGRPRAR